MSGRLLTTRQAAAMLRRSPRTVQDWVRTGYLAVVATPRGVRIPLRAVEDVLVPVGPTTFDNSACEPRTAVDTGFSGGGYTGSEGDECDDSAPHKEASMPNLSDYLTLDEASEYVGRSTRTVRRWITLGYLPGTRRLRQQLLVPRDALDALFEPAGPTAEDDDANSSAVA